MTFECWTDAPLPGQQPSLQKSRAQLWSPCVRDRGRLCLELPVRAKASQGSSTQHLPRHGWGSVTAHPDKSPRSCETLGCGAGCLSWMWIIPSSASHRCSAPSSSSRLVTFGLKAQSCLFHTGLTSCPELTDFDLFYTAPWKFICMSNTQNICFQLAQVAHSLATIQTWPQSPSYFVNHILPKKQCMDPLKWANTCQEERGILSLGRNVTDLTTPEACESSSH